MERLYVIANLKDSTFLVDGKFTASSIKDAEKLKTGPACAIKMNLELPKRRKCRAQNIDFKSNYRLVEVL